MIFFFQCQEAIIVVSLILHNEEQLYPREAWPSVCDAMLSAMLFNHKVQDRNRHTAYKQRGYLAEHQRYCQTLEDRIRKDDRGTDHNSKGSQEHGSEADSTGFDHCLFKGQAMA